MNPEAPAIKDSALETMVKDYQAVMAMIDRLSRAYPAKVLQQMVYNSTLKPEHLRDETEVARWVARLGEGLDLDTRTGTKYTFSVTRDEERGGLYLPKVTIFVHGIPPHEHVFSHDFFESSSYGAIARLGETLEGG